MLTSLSRRLSVLFAVSIGLSVLAAPALADDVSNRLDVSIDATAEVMPLNVDGAVGTTTLYINPESDDGHNGCNFQGHESLTLSVSSSDTSKATVSPSSVTFGSCGDERTLTVTPHDAGSATISVAQTSNTTGDTFNLTSATFTVNVTPPPNNPPSVSVTGFAPGAAYELGVDTLPSPGCSVTDEEDGPSNPAPVVDDQRDAYGLGTVEVTCSYTDKGGLMAQSSAAYTVVDTIDPAITFVSRTPANGHGWNKDDVTVTWSCTDAGSGVVTDTVTKAVKDEGANQSAIGTCTDNAGHTASETVTGINIDKTAPTIDTTRTPVANDADWNNTDVLVSWTCTDTLSGPADPSGSSLVSDEGAGQSRVGNCEDKAGNTSDDAVSDINIDKTAPGIQLSRTPAANGAGWSNADVTVSWTCTDGLSGVTSAGGSTTLSTDGAGQSAGGTCTDLADNQSSGTVTGVNIDKTAPTVGLVGGPADGASYYFGQVPSEPTCSASDELSGLADSCSVSGYSTASGTHTVTASATDRAGNSSTDSRTYEVKAWTLAGFYSPVDMKGVWNVVKGGSTVPMKFEAFRGASEITDVSTLGATFTVQNVTCDNLDAIDPVELTTTGGTSLRYDATAGQFIQNWQTPKKAGACYNVSMTSADGSDLHALFKLK